MTLPTAIAVAVSDVFRVDGARGQLEGFADAYEFRDRHGPEGFDTDRPTLLHSDESLIAPLDVDRLVRRIAGIARGGQLRLLSLHAPSCYTAPGIQGRMFVPGGERMSVDAMLSHACRNVEALRTRLGHEVVIAVENNNHLPTEAYDEIADPVFLTRLVHEAGCALLLDLSHAAISAHHRREHALAYLDALPLDRVVQLHLAGRDATGDVWVDDHSEPSDADWGRLEMVLPRLPALQFVTIEYYGSLDLLVALHQRLRQVLERGRRDDAAPRQETA